MDALMPSIEEVAAVMHATAHHGAAAGYRAIEALSARLFAHRLFTVTRSLHATMEVERTYSTDPVSYPVGGRKQKQGTPWGAQVLDRGEVLICHGEGDIRRVFADHAIILGMGIRGMINVPVLLDGRSRATMNISSTQDRFGPADLPAMGVLAGLLLPLVLA